MIDTYKTFKEVNLKTIYNNLKYIEEKSERKVIAIVKSDAYGNGAVKVAKYLEKDVEIFGVINLQEALELLESGIKTNILILNALDKTEYKYIRQYENVIYTVNSFNDLSYLSENAKIFLQVDTGMNRFGFKDINEYKKAVDSPYNIIGVYTHVSDKENLINQENKFKEYLKIKNYPYVHMGGSVAYSTRVVGNYIRIGFDLYGDSQKDNIKQAVKFYSKILTINNLEKGETVGYGREYVMKEKGRVAVLPVGYNDGLRRSLKGFLVSINNKLYPIIGRICMNHCFVLIDDDVLEEDEVIFYSSDYSVNHMADFAKTNSYEAFCMMKPNHYIYIS